MNPVEAGWRAVWREHPRLMRLVLWVTLGSLAAAAVFTWRTAEYRREVRALRSGMSALEKVKTDLALASDAKRLQVMMTLAVRQARVAGNLHLSIAVDSGVLHLEQQGAVLRSARVDVGADGWVSAAGDSIPIASPRGVRHVVEVRGDSQVVLSGGTMLYRDAPGRPARAGSVRLDAADLKSILPNLKTGLPVYFY